MEIVEIAMVMAVMEVETTGTESTVVLLTTQTLLSASPPCITRIGHAIVHHGIVLARR